MVAAEHLLHKTDAEINEIASSNLEAQIRSVFRNHTFDELDRDLEPMAAKLHAIARLDLLNMGIEIRAFIISEVSH